jgi:hypothetical protein
MKNYAASSRWQQPQSNPSTRLAAGIESGSCSSRSTPPGRISDKCIAEKSLSCSPLLTRKSPRAVNKIELSSQLEVGTTS